MIPFNFEYYEPVTIQEAVGLFHRLKSQGKRPLYFGGGTEIITLGRINVLTTDAVININRIKECNELQIMDNQYVLGAGISLTQAVYQEHFLLLSRTANEIADQTARNKISLGGNICSNIRFKEAILPFLVTDSKVLLANRNGVEEKFITEAFSKNYQLPVGTLLIQLLVDEKNINLPFFSKKVRTIGTVGYPVITINAIKIDGFLKIAVSGASELPIQSARVDTALNLRTLSYKDRIKSALEIWPEPMIDDIQGSASYKRFLLENTLLEIYKQLEVE